jgi:hypothetical protein
MFVFYCIVIHLQFHFEENSFEQCDEDRLPKLKKDVIPCVMADSQPKRPRLCTDNDFVITTNADHSYATHAFFSDDCFVVSGNQIPFPDVPDGSSKYLQNAFVGFFCAQFSQ